jgi:predicted ArsR family transcriptional regulator
MSYHLFSINKFDESEDAVNWQRLAEANTHPLRIAILEVLDVDGGRTLSPKDLSIELQTPLSTVNYHVTELAEAGLLELVGERPVRGATEHFYRAGEGRREAENGHGDAGRRRARVWRGRIERGAVPVMQLAD